MKPLSFYTKDCTTAEDALSAAAKWVYELLETSQASYGHNEPNNNPIVCAFDGEPLGDLRYTKREIDGREEYWYSAEGVEAISQALEDAANHITEMRAKMESIIDPPQSNQEIESKLTGITPETMHEAKFKDLHSTIQHLNDQVSAHQNTQGKRIAALESMIFVIHDALDLPKLDYHQFNDSDGMRSILSVYTSTINTLKDNNKANSTESQPNQGQQNKISELEGRLVTAEKRIASLLEERSRGRRSYRPYEPHHDSGEIDRFT